MGNLQELSTEITTKDAYSRFKTSSWFENIYKRDVLVIGSGGIASWTNLLLARCGCNLYIYDFDKAEAHNISGQLFRVKDNNKYKVDAIKEIILDFCDEETQIETFNEKYTKDSMTNQITICGVDNMIARKDSFNNWAKFLEENPEERNNSLFIDGRLSLNVYQVFCIKGNDLSSIYEYQNKHLFDDSEVEDEECTAKQSSFMAASIAGRIVGLLTNFLAPENYSVPFFTEFILPLQITNND